MVVPLLWPALLGAAFGLQPPGEFHGDEPVARDGERWLALRVDGRDAALLATRLRVAPVFDALLDEPDKTSGRAVSSPLDDMHVQAFLRGPGLRAGPVVPAVVEGEAGDGLPAWRMAFAGGEYRIDTRCTAGGDRANAADEGAAVSCTVTLHHADGRRQTLVRMDGYRDAAALLRPGDDAAPALLFAGDLDRDGRLDLVFDTTDHYNLLRPTLFLSSRAAAGELVGQVAQYQSVGC